jgi:hypothetical protein
MMAVCWQQIKRHFIQEVNFMTPVRVRIADRS